MFFEFGFRFWTGTSRLALDQLHSPLPGKTHFVRNTIWEVQRCGLSVAYIRRLTFFGSDAGTIGAGNENRVMGGASFRRLCRISFNGVSPSGWCRRVSNMAAVVVVPIAVFFVSCLVFICERFDKLAVFHHVLQEVLADDE